LDEKTLIMRSLLLVINARLKVVAVR